MRIGIDLTSKLANIHCGMANILRGYLRGLSQLDFEHEIVLFVTEHNASWYDRFADDRIQLLFSDAETVKDQIKGMDLLYFPFNELSIEQSKIPAAVQIHDLIPEEFPDQFAQVHRDRSRKFCQAADRIICESTYVRRQIIERYGIQSDKVFTVLGSLHELFEDSSITNDPGTVKVKYSLPDNFLLYPAAGRPHKNHARLFDALKKLPPRISLVLSTGETHIPERFERLKQMVIDQGLADRVRVLGCIAEQDLPALYALSTAVVVPSLSEGFGYPVLEGQKMSRPVICSNGTNLPEIAGDGARFFDPLDPEDMARKIQDVLENQSLRQELVAKGHENLKRFDPVDSARVLLDAFQSVIPHKKKSDSTTSVKSSTVRLALKSDRPLTIAYDIRRIAEHWDKPHSFLGITRYAKATFDRLHHVEGIDLQPVIYANRGEADIECLELNAWHMTTAYDDEIYLSWPARYRRYPDHFHRIESLLSGGIGAYASRASLDLLLGPEQTSRLRRKYLENEAARRATWRAKGRLIHDQPAARARWDIYHSPFHALPPKSWTGSAKRVVIIADCIYHLHPEQYPGNDTPYITKILDSIDPATDYVITISEATRQDVLKCIPIDPERVFAIHLAHDPLFNRPNRLRCQPLLQQLGVEPGKYVLALGQPNPRKNVARLAAAWHELKKTGKYPDYHLVFAVSSHFEGRFKEQLKKSGAPLELFKYALNVDDPMLASLYANAAAFAYVSLFEGFGLPPLEAMAAGCPVVVSNLDVLSEVTCDNGLYVDPHDPSSIVHALEHILALPDHEREGIGCRLRKRAKMFGSEKWAEGIARVYGEMI